MRLLICGSRHWTDAALILRELSALQGVEVVIEGEAPGADTLAVAAARALGIPVLPFPAYWEREGRAAGPLRNQRLLDEANTDLASALPENLGQSSRGIRAAVFRLAGGAPAGSSGRTWSSPSART